MPVPTVHIKRAVTVLVTFDAHGPCGYDYFTRRAARLDGLDFALLSALGPWTEPGALFAGLAAMAPRAHIARALLRLLDLGLVIAQGTEAAHQDTRMAREWKWGPMAGHYHFGIKNTVYQGPEDVLHAMAMQVATAPKVPLYQTNEGPAEIVALGAPAPHADGTEHAPAQAPSHASLHTSLIDVMRRRRSYRGFDPAPDASLPRDALRDCLFCGLAITGFVNTPTPGEGPLPLTMTPSGGARNPYEAYVYARNVRGLRPGLYHYSGLDSTLGLVTARDLPSIGSLLGDQDWFDAASAVILLVANFDRCMWKYDHPTGLRVVLLEGGHIAQNILLAATARGLASAPTCAISDQVAERLCGLDPVRQAAVYAVALGPRGPRRSRADSAEIMPNPHLP